MEHKDLRPAEVILDPENPRLPEGTTSDKEAINQLIADGPEQLIELAADLVKEGQSNPAELPIVIRKGSKFVVLEGNRRFAALKLMADPMLANSSTHQESFRKLTSKGTAPTTMFCAIAKDRESADHWILLRHTGSNRGIGVKRWSATQTATHRRRMKAPVDSATLRSIAIADDLTEAYQADSDLVKSIQAVRSSKLTNIGRLFAGDVLTRLQFETRRASDRDADEFYARHTADDLHEFFQWAFEFLEHNPVDAFKNPDIRANLLNKHAQLLPDPASALPEKRRITESPFSMNQNSGSAGDGSGGDSGSSGPGGKSGGGSQGSTGNGAEGGKGSEGSKGRKQDQKPEKFLYSGVSLSNLSKPVQRLLKEAKSLTLEDHYATGCVLARVILELAVSSPEVLKWSGAKENDKLSRKIRACLFKLDADISNPIKRTRGNLEQAYQETDEFGIRYLHQFMHNTQVASDPHLARRFSGAFTPLLNSVNDEMAS